MTLTLEQIAEIEAGCEGVTPWRDGNLARYTHGGGRLAILRDDTRELLADFYGDGLIREHFTRLDPTTVRELCRLARIGMQAECLQQDNGHE